MVMRLELYIQGVQWKYQYTQVDQEKITSISNEKAETRR